MVRARVVHAPRGGHASAPPAAVVADAPHHPTVGTHARRAPRTTHRAHAARTTLIAAHCGPRTALHRAPRATPRHTLRHAPPVCSSHSWARAAWGRCSQKNAGRPPIFSSCIRWRACLSSILHRAPRCAPRTTRHAAPRCATHHPCGLTMLGPGPLLTKGRRAATHFLELYSLARVLVVHFAPRAALHRARCATPRHAAPRRATLRHARCRCHNPRWRPSERPGQAPRVSLGIR